MKIINNGAIDLDKLVYGALIEQKKPISKSTKYNFVKYYCGGCGAGINRGNRYCARCGVRIDWRKDESIHTL